MLTNRSKMPRSALPLMLVASLAVAACGGAEEPAAEPVAPAGGSVADGEAAAEGAGAAAPGSEAHPELGSPLEHPERYHGVYAHPDEPNRRWFVTEARRPPEAEQAPEVPPGYLALGAMFGDVAPWHMRTLSETEFEQARVSEFQPEPIAVEFELDGDGEAVAMTFTGGTSAPEGRFVREGDLPAEWR